MPPRIQLPADFKPWRLACLGCGVGLIALGMRILLSIPFAKLAGATAIAVAGPAILGFACFITAGIFIAPQIVGVVARPITAWFDQMFYPTETLREPPATLLFALRQRLRDRHWEPVAQQLEALQRAYGPSPELLHLRAHLLAGQTGEFKTVTADAVSRLSTRAFDRYTALLRRDPPPAALQTGIDA